MTLADFKADQTLRLGVRVASQSGVLLGRWAGDEPDAVNVPEGLRFATSMPGGFASGSCSLRRDPERTYPDLNLFDDVQFYGPGSQIAFEGRQAELPKHVGDDATIAPSAVGWSAHLLDDPTLREIYVDRRFEKWGEPTHDRLDSIAAADVGYDQDFHVKNSGHALMFTSITDKQIQANSKVEAWYIAPPGVNCGLIEYKGYERNIGANQDAATLYGSPDGVTIPDSYGLTLDASSGAATLRTKTLTTARKYLMLRLAEAVTVASKATASHRVYLALAVYGTHGLTLRANDRSGDPDGVYGEDVIADVLNRWAPKLNSDRSYIEAGGGFVIPHLVFEDQTTASDAITAINAFYLFDWGVYDNRTFFWRNPTHFRRRWVVRLSEGATYDAAGATGEDAVNGVIVQFTDEFGVSRTAGPTGTSCDYTDSSLGDTTSTNPVNEAGLTKYGVLQITPTTSQYGAIQLGQRWLSEALQLPDRGSVTAVGRVTDYDSGLDAPAWMMRAGDSVRVADGDNSERRIVATDYTHDSFSNSLTLDNLPAALDAMMERMGVELIGHVSTSA